VSQRSKVLRLLQQAGDRGVTNAVFLDWRIPRFGGRIFELREEGYEILTEAEGHSRVRYVLVSEPDVERTSSNPPDPPADAPSSGVGATAQSRGSKAPGVSGGAGLITRAPAAGSLDGDSSLSTGSDRLFEMEPERVGHYDREAA
jgi:hypothetical protein